MSNTAKQFNAGSLGTLRVHCSKSAKHNKLRLNESFLTVLIVTNNLYQTKIF